MWRQSKSILLVLVICALGCSTSSQMGGEASVLKTSPDAGIPDAVPETFSPEHAAKMTENTIGMKFVTIPAGTVKIGSPETDKEARPDETPQHWVEFDEPFEMAIHEVTIGQFRKFVQSARYRTLAEQKNAGFAFNASTQRLEPKTGSSWKSVGFTQTDDHPVINIAYEDATAFCDWLSKLENTKYRLPTEPEWEYACRAGTETRWHCGDDVESLKKYSNLCDVSLMRTYPHATWCVQWDDGFPFTAPVGSFRPNGFGLFDMHGNVFEWCSDLWPEFGYDGKKLSDPDETPQPGSRIIRGGSFLSLTTFTRSADRVGLNPELRNCIVGFRVVRPIVAELATPSSSTPAEPSP